MSQNPTAELLKPLSKPLVANLLHDLYDFYMARRACRKHVLDNATIRHEPLRLINGSIWGASLFPPPLVEEVMKNAVSHNQNIRTRWGMDKRKYTEGFGPQPKSSKRKYYSNTSSSPMPSTSHTPRGQSFPATPQASYYSSPANNPRYEREPYRYGGDHPQRRGRGRGNRGRGQPGFQPGYQPGYQTSYRGAPQGRGRGGSHHHLQQRGRNPRAPRRGGNSQ